MLINDPEMGLIGGKEEGKAFYSAGKERKKKKERSSATQKQTRLMEPPSDNIGMEKMRVSAVSALFRVTVNIFNPLLPEFLILFFVFRDLALDRLFSSSDS